VRRSTELSSITLRLKYVTCTLFQLHIIHPPISFISPQIGNTSIHLSDRLISPHTQTAMEDRSPFPSFSRLTFDSDALTCPITGPIWRGSQALSPLTPTFSPVECTFIEEMYEGYQYVTSPPKHGRKPPPSTSVLLANTQPDIRRLQPHCHLQPR
jgi:hypothetical protein